MSNQVSARLVISGRVQGVSFRYYTRETALNEGVQGWVRNCLDGTVEALVQGDPPAVERVISWCRQGPPAAEVTKVQTEWLDAVEACLGFDIRR